MPVIDVHTHMLNKQWLELLRRHGTAPTIRTISAT
jgi:hypothetical protein